MNDAIQRACDRFLENRQMIEQTLHTREHSITGLYAVRFLDMLVLDEELLKESKRILKHETGIFSGFRGYAQNACILALAASETPESHMDAAKHAYDVMKKAYGRNSHTALAAMQLADQIQSWQLEDMVQKSKQIFKQIKRENPLRFSLSDGPSFLYPLVGLGSKETALERIRTQYQILGDLFSKGEGGRGAALVLSLSEEPAEQTAQRLRSLYDLLRQNGLRYSRYEEISALALLVQCGQDPQTLEAAIEEVHQYLVAHKYKSWDMSKKTGLMHAVLIAAAALGAPELSLELCLQILIRQIVRNKEAATAAAAS